MLINYYSLRREGAERELRTVKEDVFHYDGKTDQPGAIVDMMCEFFDLRNLAEERLYMLVYTSSRIVGVIEISRGGFDASYASTREIFSKALLLGACSIILIHNHPSWEIHPSKQDMEVACRVKEAGKLLDIELLDFIIVGDGYYSFCEKKEL